MPGRQRYRLFSSILPSVAVAALALAVAACSAPGSGSPPASGGTSTAAGSSSSAAAGPIKIAVVDAQSGSESDLGQFEWRGVSLAVNQANAAGGVDGRKIQLTLYDDQGDPTVGTELARKIASEGDIAMLGTAESAVTIAMAPILKSEQIPNITSGQSVGLIALHSPYLFLNSPTGLTYDTTLAKFLVTTKGYKKIAMLTNNDSYGAGEDSSFTSALKSLGVTPVASKVVPSDQTNMTPALTAIRGSDPQVLFIGAEEAQSGLIVKQARALGMTVVFAEGAPAGTPLFLSTAGAANANGTIDRWEFRPRVGPFDELGGVSVPYRPVTLPHDAMIGQQRVAPGGQASRDGGASAYFPGGAFEYRKTFFVPEEHRGRRILVEFEGVYRDAMVYVNGDFAGQHPYGYSLFRVDADRFLRFGADNEIRVEARAHQDSRWYTGAGIYRDTWLLTGGLVRIAPGGVRVTTPDTDTERAVVEVAAIVENDSIAIRTPRLATEIRDAAGNVVAADTCPVSVLPGEPATARQRLYVRAPRLWSPDSPALYTAQVTLTDEDGEADAETVTFGIRSLRLDPDHGLRINGDTVKLRGACVHHDNGVLGAATFARAEERRVRLLKDAGFNAIRMSHHPASTALLDACDRLGVLVMDEAFDMWTSAKSDFDHSVNFPQWWERDIEAMVAKDVNHPSVILYSIGNEIPETGSPSGAAWGRRLAEKVRALDGTRYVTNAVNGMVAVLGDLAAMRSRAGEGAGVNSVMADPGDMMNAVSSSDLVTRRTAESFSVLDVAGINYGEARYGLDRDLFPNRIIVGSETFPTRIGGNWRLVKQYANVIGDFTWTGWDYLGEAGIGRPQYAAGDGTRPSLTGPYPYLLAGCGDIDITGHRRPASYYRQIVFGLRAEPYLAVRRPEHHGQTFTGSPWAWSDSIASWTWPGSEGAPVTVEVYSDADEVELLVNGRSLGREPAGDSHRFRAEADRLVITADGGALAYVTLTLTDQAGTCHAGADRPVRVEVSGPGVLLGFGTACPSTEERFDATERRSYEGRALAVLRPAGPGKIRLTASAPECEPAEVVITAE